MTPQHSADCRARKNARGLLRKEFWLTPEELAAVQALLAQMRGKDDE